MSEPKPGDARAREGACPHCKRPLTPMQFYEVGGWKPVPTVNAADGYPDRCAGPLPDGGGYALACWGEVEHWKARALKARAEGHRAGLLHAASVAGLGALDAEDLRALAMEGESP